MQLVSKRRQMKITALDRDGLAALAGGDYRKVCELCGASFDEAAETFLSTLAIDRADEEQVEEGGVLWNTFWLGVSGEEGRFEGGVKLLGRPTESRELTVDVYPVNGYESPRLIYVFSRVCEWAFNHRTVYYIRVALKEEAEEPFLRHLGFVQNQADGFFEREKNQSSWVLISLCLGMGTGIAMGEAFGDISLGLAVGAVFGFTVGWLLDHRDISRRKKQAEEKGDNNEGV